jgi:8-oxo-dGTP diphosphatase
MTIELPPLVYTLCFLTRGDEVLMLLRNKPPNRGLWNGVGGHIEPGEKPLQSVLREVAEETGYVLPTARFCGLLTWEGYEIPSGGSIRVPLYSAGLYIFTAAVPQETTAGCCVIPQETTAGCCATPEGEPRTTPEGALAWKPKRWVFTSDDVVSNIHYFGPRVLDGATPQIYHFAYRDGLIQSHTVYPLPEGFQCSA